jgi:hypothetical protein
MGYLRVGPVAGFMPATASGRQRANHYDGRNGSGTPRPPCAQIAEVAKAMPAMSRAVAARISCPEIPYPSPFVSCFRMAPKSCDRVAYAAAELPGEASRAPSTLGLFLAALAVVLIVAAAWSALARRHSPSGGATKESNDA